jgi:hypothetical protein
MTSKTLILLLTLTTATTAGAEPMSCSLEPVVQVSDAGCAEAATTPPLRPATLTRGRLFHQIRYHLSLPASRPRILDTLAATAELNDAEAAWIATTLPRRTFATGAEVLAALFPDAPADVLARVERPSTVVASR